MEVNFVEDKEEVNMLKSLNISLKAVEIAMDICDTAIDEMIENAKKLSQLERKWQFVIQKNSDVVDPELL